MVFIFSYFNYFCINYRLFLKERDNKRRYYFRMKNLILIFFIFLFISNVYSYVSTCNGPDSYTANLKPWSYGSSWISGKIPVTGDKVEIPSGYSILLDVSTPRLTQIWIQSGGQLVISSKHGPLEIITDGILIEGRMDVGDENCKFNESFTVTLTGIEGQGYIEKKSDMLQKYIGVLPGGSLEVHGYLSYPIPTWTKLNKTITGGSTMIINVADDVSMWPVGSTIVLGSTDFDMYQSEEVITLSCPECSAYQLKINGSKYYHFGAITFGVDERAEVGLLTKNIVVRGEMQPTCNGSRICDYFNFDGFGGHIKFVKGFANGHLEGMEVYNMGQTYNVGYYPIHFHMCGDVDTGSYANWPSYVKDVSIHHTKSRCLTIHGTSGLVVVNNFAYDHYGHCYFFEDGSEQRNYLDSNVGLVTRYGYLLPSDRDGDVCIFANPTDYNGNAIDIGTCQAVATFWITNPNNYLKNNVAGGSANTGFWFLFPEAVSGISSYISAYDNVYPPYIPIGSFVNNKAHSNVLQGMNIDQSHQIQQQSADYPNPHLSMTYGRYKPRVDPTNPSSARATSLIYQFTAYKNKWRGLWARGGDLVFHSCIFSENAIGATLAAEGVMQADMGSTQQCIGCTFILETENVGQATNGLNTYGGVTLPAYYQFSQRGIEIYDGPVILQYCTFIGFNTDGSRNTSAIGWFLYDDWIFSTTNQLIGSTFINSNLRVLNIPSNYDGAKQQIFLDADGSVTGTKNSYVVPSVPYFYSSKSVINTAWNMSISTEKFASLYVYNKDVAGSNIPDSAGIIMVRDEYSYYRHILQGVPNGSPRNTFLPTVMLGKSYTMHFPHATPPHLQVQLTNFDQSDQVIVGICYPTWGVTFEITKNVIINNWNAVVESVKMVDSLDQVKNDTKGLSAYYDSVTGLLFLNAIQERTRQWNYFCPDVGCETFDIQITGLGVNTNTGYCSSSYPKYSKLSLATRGGCNGDPNLVYDICGVCGGDGSTCGATTNKLVNELGLSNSNSAISINLLPFNFISITFLIFSIIIILL
ncbi:transmembrane protein [Dictyostelium discoideum AX4]|uniref:Transmembrane protein n=1 Tax=Dictyostelium discoideum TaxID=44689 RepID=Q55D62_DICDI|nr:transmembrane protein [Dictyostelium discoideum AX4]EAL72668.1 transmembrane protein [Dictyostelium discoideum AX4]|eukprot:XP_646269.1 transmembrane protein [Dictyostelium discoideum AX4]